MVSPALTPELAERVGRLSDEALVLVLDAFRAGRRAEAERIAAELSAYVDDLLEEMERTAEAVSPSLAARMEETYRGAGLSPVVAAHFGHAADILTRVRGRIRRLVRVAGAKAAGSER
ncbi:MAG TPA: hypothetical protein RMH99_30760 [Sandaracinaceae bacterium LLY-WYZ-13_1]|nr:hypothetical protein [Sandaracinaceae bacterium LLY-WYZ-13_1]